MNILIDKDGRVDREVVARDRQYWIKKPTEQEFDDCCNEFWMTSTYVVKGLARREILFAVDYLHEIVRPNLLRMMAWDIGAVRGYTFSVGKNYKYIERYLPKSDWERLLSTYATDSYERTWSSLFACHELFRTYARAVADRLGYAYPSYDEAITAYTQKIYEETKE